MKENNHDIEGIYQEYKLVREKLKVLQHDYSEALLKKEDVDKLLEKQKETLTATINQIASQKLEWASEKAVQEREIAEKQEKCDKILSKEAELARQEIALKAEKEAIESKLKANNAILLKIEDEKEANHVIIREIEDKNKKLDQYSNELDKKKEAIKSDLLKITEEINKL